MSKSTKYSLFGVILLVTLLFATVYVNGESEMNLLGQDHSSIMSNADSTIIAIVDGEEITKKVFESYKLSLNQGNTKYSDDEVLDKIIEKKLLYKNAIADGIAVDDNDVDKYLQEVKNGLAQNSELGQRIKEYIEGLNITEDVYWEQVRSVYKSNGIISDYMEKLQAEYAEANNLTDKKEISDKFREYFKQFVEDLKNNSQIEIVLNE